MATHLTLTPIGTAWLDADDRLRAWYRDDLEEYAAEGGQAAWCAARGVILPTGVESRLPTPRDLRGVLENLAGLRYDFGPESITIWSYQDSDEVAMLIARGWQGNPNGPWPVHFEFGRPALQRFLVARLSEVCGPLLVGDPPDPLELITPQTATPPYWTMPGHGGLRLVRWRPEHPEHQTRQARLSSFASHETQSNQDCQGMPALLAAHDIPFGVPPREIYHWTVENFRAAMQEAYGGAVRFSSDQYHEVIAHLWPRPTGGEVVLFAQGSPYPLLFEPGEVLGQLWVAERLARLHGPHVLLPSHLSEVPILVQAGDDPARLLAEWERRTAALGP